MCFSMKSLVQTVSPNPILCISGWNLILITDCARSISQLFISDLCIHKCSFLLNVHWVLWQCHYVVMPTLKTKVTAIQFAIQMLSPDMTTCCCRSCAVVLYFVFWGSSRNAGSWNVIPRCRLRYFQNTKRYI